MDRIAAGFIEGFAVSAALGTPIIRMLERVGAKQTVSADAPAGHAVKQGTATMGGLIILLGFGLPALYHVAENPLYLSALPLLGLTMANGLIGFLDDLLIAKRGKNLGLKARQKLALQFLCAIAFVGWLWYTQVPQRTSLLRAGPAVFDLGVWYYVLGVLFIVGMSNAINLLDGLDGLAGGVTLILALALAAAPYAAAEYGWLPLFGGALAGGCAGFLLYNCHPAQVFMGDTGSLALGAALAGMTMLGKVEVPFQVCAVIPWATMVSVIIQVLVFKYRRRRYGLDYAKAHRVFCRTPLHHHFEEIGWKETKIVQRFWLVTASAVAVSLVLFAIR